MFTLGAFLWLFIVLKMWKVKCVHLETHMMANKPLKLGLIRASYPDVRPMSESRKSDGDMLEEDLDSYSLATTTLEGTHGEKEGGKKRLDRKEVAAQKVGVKPYRYSPGAAWVTEVRTKNVSAGTHAHRRILRYQMWFPSQNRTNLVHNSSFPHEFSSIQVEATIILQRWLSN